jgi:hypothetical protein
LREDIPIVIGDAVKGLAQKVLHDMDIIERLENGDMDDLISEILRKVFDEKAEINNKIATGVDGSIGGRVDQITRFDKIKKAMIHKFEGVNVDGDLNLRNIIEKIDMDNMLDKLFYVERFCEMIRDSYNCRAKDIVLGYLPDYEKNRKGYLDHGFVSSMVYFDVNRIYQKFFSAGNVDDVLRRFMIYAYGFRGDIELREKRELILAEVGYAIFVHNIYPKYMRSSGLIDTKQSLSKNPFVFLCLLADSLQPWNRAYSINQAVSVLPYATYGNTFDMRIEKNKIKISERSHDMNVGIRLKSFMDSLDEYLINASSLIELNLSNWS